MASQIETGLSIAIITLVNTANLAAVEYVKNPSNPQRYWNHQEAHWQFNGHAMGLAQSDLVIPKVLWTEDQMRRFMGLGYGGLLTRLTHKQDIPFYLPPVVSGPDGLPLFTKAYPWMSWNQEYLAEIQNVDRDGEEVALSGHLRTEATIDAPYTKTNEYQAADILVRLGRRGHTVNSYVEAGNQSKLLTGQYLDDPNTWIRVMLSRVHGRVVRTYFHPFGCCGIYWGLRPGYADGSLGVRSVGI